MSRVSADTLRELIIYLMIENAQVAAAVSPIIRPPFLDVDNLGIEFDRALEEINDIRTEGGKEKIEVDAGFKQAVIDTLMRRMEAQGRVMVG